MNSRPSREDIADLLDEITGLVKEQTAHDFSQYKTSTLIRRVHRRMQMLELASAHEYLEHLHRDPAECTDFFKEMLIGVTQFFRDPESFEALGAQVIAPLLARRSPDEQVRIWVPACSSGEELYSIAMLICEQAE